MAIEDWLSQQAVILAEAADGQQPAQDSFGGTDRTAGRWLTVVDGVPCLFRSRSSTMAAFSGRQNDARQQQVDARIYFAADPTPGGITSRHRIRVSGCPRAADNGTYAVIGAIDPNAMGRLLQVDVQRVRP